jgi:hypothetical protein
VRAAAAWVVLVGCSFDHGASMQPDAACTRRSGTPWWSTDYQFRHRIDTGGAPPGYTVTVDASPLSNYFLSEGYEGVTVVVDHTTAIDREFTRGRMFVKVPVSGALWAYGQIGSGGVRELEDPNNVFVFAESFDSDASLSRFDLQPPGDWSHVEYGGLFKTQVLRVTGAGRHPAAIKNLMLGDGEISVRMRIRAGTGQQHNGLAARGKSMQPATMDGFVGQVQADVQRLRIAEYTDGVSPPAELAAMDRPLLNGYSMKLRFVGDTVSLYLGDELVLTTTRAGSDGELLGLFAHDCDVEFDDVRVRHAIDPEPVVTIGPPEPYCD